mmetsp:Transcript_143000/g.202256  ORF Transcript_143000/g.202256 Transcript_143000/m.202256 type:complete len:108 (+) Transcript_143000:75-398(+)
MLTLKRLVIAGLVTVIAASTGLRNGQGQQGIIEVLDHMRHALSPKEVPETIQAPAASGASALTEAEGSENHTRGHQGGGKILTVPLNSELQQGGSSTEALQTAKSKM